MPIVQSFNGVTREITLDPSVANSSWRPVDLFAEYLRERRDNEQFRGFEPLLIMRGGEPKTSTTSAPRFLQLLTDSRGITTKLLLPDIGPYRTRVDGELATDVPDTDPEPFNVSNLTTTGVIVDYKPTEAEIISVATGSGLTPEQDALLTQIGDVLIDVEAGYDADALLRIILAATAGKGGNPGDGTFRYRDIQDTKDRIVAPVVGEERSSVTLDPT